MSGIQSLISSEPDAYEVIARAMGESERGRWFLAEHARRNRGPDTEMLLGAIGRLESVVTAQRPPEEMSELRGNLLDMARAISRTKSEIAAISPADADQSRLGVASEALDAIVRTTERATSDILGAAEEMQEAAWTLRERGIEAAFCDRLDRHATQIYTACSFQDLTAQRIVRIVNTLRYLESRLTAMIAIWDGDAEPIPTAPAAAVPIDLSQSDVDRFIGMDRAMPEGEDARARLDDTSLDDAVDFAPLPAPSTRPEAGMAVAATAAIDDLAWDSGSDLAGDASGEASDAPAGEVAEDAAPTAVVGLTDAATDVELPGGPGIEAAAEPEEAAIAVAETGDEDLDALTVESAGTDLDPMPASSAQAADLGGASPGTESSRPDRADLSLADIDLLSIEEKLALFS